MRAILNLPDPMGVVRPHLGELVARLEARAVAGSLPGSDGRRLEVPCGISGRQDFALSMAIPPESLSLADKVDRCRVLQQRLRKGDPRVQNAPIAHYHPVE